MKVWNLSKGGGRGQTPNPNFFGIHFGSIEIKICGRSWAIDTYFWIQTLGGRGRVNKKFGRNPYFHFCFLKTSLTLPFSSLNMCTASYGVNIVYNIVFATIAQPSYIGVHFILMFVSVAQPSKIMSIVLL